MVRSPGGFVALVSGRPVDPKYAVQGLGFRVWGLGFRAKHWLNTDKHWLNTEYSTLCCGRLKNYEHSSPALRT